MAYVRTTAIIRMYTPCLRREVFALFLTLSMAWSFGGEVPQKQVAGEVGKQIALLREWRRAKREAVIAAVEQLGRRGPAAAEAVCVLIPLLGSDPEIRQPVVSALAEIGAPAVPGLIAVLEERDQQMTMCQGIRRDGAIGCMEVFRRMDSRLQKEQVIPALRALVAAHANYDVSKVVHGAKGGAPKGSSEYIWMNAVDCLAALGNVSVPVLKKALKDGFHEDLLAEKIGKLATESYPAIQAMNEKPDGSAKKGWEAFFSRALTEPGPERVSGVLEELSRDEQSYLPYLAMLLDRIGPEGVPALTKVLADTKQDWYVRDGVALALEMMGPEAKAALPALEKIFRDREDDIHVRIGAAKAITSIRGIAPFSLYKQAPELESNVVRATREKSTAWRRSYLKREGARKDLAPYAEEHSSTRWETTAWWVHAFVSGENLDLANQSLKAAAETGHIGSFMDVNSVRAFVMCHSKSRFFPRRLSPDTEKALKRYFFNQCDHGGTATKKKPWVAYSTSQLEKHLHAPEDVAIGHNGNIPMNMMSRDYLALSVLRDDPEYRDRKFEAGDTVVQRYEAWNAFWKRFLKDWALNGLWNELASSSYTYHTYPSYFNLAELSPDPVVRQRATMWLDLSFVESAQMSISRVRGGSKSRAKRGGLGSNFDSYAAFLYGERGATRYHGSIAASEYQLPEAVVLLRKLGPPIASFEIANRHPGEVVYFTDPNIKDGRGKPRQLKKTLKHSRNINYAYCAPEYVMGCAMYDPNLNYGDGTCGRWSGILFRNLAAIYMNAYTGEKWNVQSKDVMIAQRRMGTRYKYKGRSQIVFESCFTKVERHGWVFVDNGEAYAAVNVVQGGTFWADPIQRRLYPHDDYSPIIFQVGRQADYGSFATFQEAVLKAPLELKDGKLTYHGLNSSKLEFSLATREGEQILPTIDGRTIDLDLEYSYKSPYMESRAGSDIVTVSFGSRKWEYDFEKNTVAEVAE